MTICYEINHTDGSFKLLWHYDLRSDVAAWLDENAPARWDYSWDTFDDPKIRFVCEEDLLAFKLRWL